MIRPRLSKVASGTRLTTDLINDIINRTEYAADLLRQYKLVAGTEMYVEPHFDGTRVSYFYPVGGGSTPRGSDITIPILAQGTPLKFDEEVSFPEGGVPIEETGRDRKLYVPKSIWDDRESGSYGLRFTLGAYWANFDRPSENEGFYQVLSFPTNGGTYNLNDPFWGSVERFPFLGPHPSVNGVSYWFGGSVTLIRLN